MLTAARKRLAHKAFLDCMELTLTLWTRDHDVCYARDVFVKTVLRNKDFM